MLIGLIKESEEKILNFKRKKGYKNGYRYGKIIY